MLHTLNGFLCAAVGFSLVDLLNRSSDKISLSPIYVTLVAFCFSMTIGVLWEFVEFSFDSFLGMDMQKDTIVSSISSVALDPTDTGTRIHVDDIVDTAITCASGEVVHVAGYLDIGLIDTMKDLLVNFAGAMAFSVVGYEHLKRGEQGSWADGLRVVPVTPQEEEETDVLLEHMAVKRNERRLKRK